MGGARLVSGSGAFGGPRAKVWPGAEWFGTEAGQDIARAAAQRGRGFEPTANRQIVRVDPAVVDRSSAGRRPRSAMVVCDEVGVSLTTSWVGAPVTATQVSRLTETTRPPMVVSMAAALSWLPTIRLASRYAVRSAAPDGETPRCARPARP